VVLCPQGAVCGVDVRGAAPGTRETDLLRPDNLVEQVHAVLLTGGSAFGLDAAGGVMRWLERTRPWLCDVGRGQRVPIVPAAVLFDLWLGDGVHPARRRRGYAACDRGSTADHRCRAASVPAPVPAVGKLFGIERGDEGRHRQRVAACRARVTVAALVAVNATGDVIDPASGRSDRRHAR
jgi:L-aminopeptidase/D-esterase-like protein